MGVGTPDDILSAVAARYRHVRLRHSHPGRPNRTRLYLRPVFAICATPASPTIPPRLILNAIVPACSRHSRAYLHHLFRAEEMLGPMLLTWHNVRYYQSLMQGIRTSIHAGHFSAYAASVRAGWTGRMCLT